MADHFVARHWICDSRSARVAGREDLSRGNVDVWQESDDSRSVALGPSGMSILDFGLLICDCCWYQQLD